MARRGWLVYVLFLVSGATALIYEVAWVRDLSLIFGASHQAVSIVLGSFMLGLALGGFYFGRRSERIRSPLRLYGWLELGVAAFALAMPTLQHWVDGFYVSAAEELQGEHALLTVTRVAAAFSLLVLPTFFMGGTLPVLVRFMVRRREELGSRLSVLYSINTFGAVLGVFAAGFLLLPRLGVRHTELFAVAANVIIGVVAILIARRSDAADEPTPDSVDPAPTRRQKRGATDDSSVQESLRPATYLAFFGTAVCGLCALGLEVMWSRGIAICTGTTTYSFTIMLTAFLTGIAVGSALQTLFPLRRIAVHTRFGVVLLVIGLSALVTSQSIDRLPQLTVDLNQRFYSGDVGLHGWTILVLSFAVMFVPCVFFGVAFPLAGEARALVRKETGQSVGELLALNTLGAITGSMLAGFVLVPVLGLQRGTLLLSAILLAYGWAVLCAGLARRPAWRVRAALAAAAGVTALLALPWLMKPWDPRVFGLFRNNVSHGYALSGGESDVGSRAAEMQLIYFREGRSTTISVMEYGGSRALVVNGRSEATSSMTDLQHEYLLGHVPVLAHPNPRTALVIGLGAGVTLSAVASHPEIEEITLVEIEPVVPGGTALFSDVNDDVMNDPRLRIVFQDGRNYLRTCGRKFDVITADPIHPWAHGAAYLYTTEYFQQAATRLNPGGVMCQWLPLYELSVENLGSMAGSFCANFTSNTVWQSAFDAVLVGSNSPIRIDFDQLERRIQAPTVNRQLARVGLNDALSFLAEFTMEDTALREFCAGAPINTDDNLYLEFSSPLSIGVADVQDNIRLIDSFRRDPRLILVDPTAVADTPAAADELMKAYFSAKSKTVAATSEMIDVDMKSPAQSLARIIEKLRAVLQTTPRYARVSSLMANLFTQLGAAELDQGALDAAVASLRTAVEIWPSDAEARCALGAALERQGQSADACAQFEETLRIQPRFAMAHLRLAVSQMSLGRLDDAERNCRASLALQEVNPEAHHALGVALVQRGQFAEAISHLQTSLQQSPRNPEAYHHLALALRAAGRASSAVDALRDGLELDPGHVQMMTRLAWLLATSRDASVRDGAEAVQWARRAVESVGNVPPVLDTLAASLAEAGLFDDAVRAAEQALSAARELKLDALVEEISARRDGYSAKRAHRE